MSGLGPALRGDRLMRRLAAGRQLRGRPRDRGRKVTALVLAVGLTALLGYVVFEHLMRLKPPPDSGPSSAMMVKVEPADQGARLVVGDSWLEQRDDLWYLHLSGSVRAMGHAHALLTRRLVAAIDRDILRVIDDSVPRAGVRWLEEYRLRWRLLPLAESVPERRLVEMGAFGRMVASTRDLPGSPFERELMYHALFDLSETQGREAAHGSIGLAAWGHHTASGQLLVGRVFEQRVSPLLAEHKTVMVVRGDDHIPFVSVAWPGMIGSVTGVNSERIFVSMNTARTDEGLQSGTPVMLLGRQVLEQARNIKQAVAIVRKATVMGAFSMLVADGKVPAAVVIERSPNQTAVREPVGQSIAVTGHLLHPAFQGDAVNDRRRRYSSSDFRYRRLGQLLQRFKGRLDAATVALILRNRTGLNDEPLALGHGAALDTLSATHGVVADLGAMVLWVGRGPYLVGPFVGIDLKPLFGVTVVAGEGPVDIPADALQGSATLNRLLLVRRQMAYAKALRADGGLEAAIDAARLAVNGSPDLPAANKLLADLLWQRGNAHEAKRWYKEFLDLHPPFQSDMELAQRRLSR